MIRCPRATPGGPGPSRPPARNASTIRAEARTSHAPHVPPTRMFDTADRRARGGLSLSGPCYGRARVTVPRMLARVRRASDLRCQHGEDLRAVTNKGAPPDVAIPAARADSIPGNASL